ncbi:MAG: chalcone isomerase family protein [Candidatus Marinimicrobia bacterium]|nr:chalcone isomerase family protein [Candidatus Neomarinimicrobiota bacterium]
MAIRPRNQGSGGRVVVRLGGLWLSLVAAVVCGASAACGDVTFEGVRLAAERVVGGERLRLYSAGLLRAGLVFRVYAAALYLPPGGTPADLDREETAYALEIIYLRDVPARAMIDNGLEALAENLTAAELAAIQPQVDQLNALYRDVKRYDRYLLTYARGWGGELLLNGRKQGRIAGWDFARGYLSIWLGPRAASRTVRAALLRPL